ncbi:MAG: hypothetical protein ABSH41_07745 [Syntrophobacteraceae bacterium]
MAISLAKAGELLGGIVAASLEQAQGIGRISWVANEMDKVVQRNSANT